MTNLLPESHLFYTYSLLKKVSGPFSTKHKIISYHSPILRVYKASYS